MSGTPVSRQLAKGEFSTGAVAELLGIQYGRVHSLSSQGKLKKTAYDPPTNSARSNALRSRRHYRYDLDSILDTAFILFAKENKPVTAQLNTAVIRFGSSEAKAKLIKLRKTIRFRLILRETLKGTISLLDCMKACAMRPVGNAVGILEEARTLIAYNSTEGDFHKSLDDAGVYADYLVMRADQKSPPPGTTTFTFTSENPCYADILGFAALAMLETSPKASAALMALAIKEGFDIKDDSDLLALPIDEKVLAERIKIKSEEQKAGDKAAAQARAARAEERKGMSPGQIAELLRQPSNS